MAGEKREESSIDFVIVTALAEERDAVLGRLPGYRQLPPSGEDIRVYYQAEIPVTFADRSSGSYRVMVMCLPGMGRVQATVATADAIRRWHPRYVLLVGIAGGIANGKIHLGDVLIADQIVDYELQKVTAKGPQVRYDVQRADPRLLEACNNFRDEAWHTTIAGGRPEPGKPERHTGPVATGDKVIAVGRLLARYQKAWPRLVGVEMEAGGAATAAFQAADRPGFFMVRGVSDLADEDKGTPGVEKWRPYACDAAAAFAIALLRSGPAPLAAVEKAPQRPESDPIADARRGYLANLEEDLAAAYRQLGMSLDEVERARIKRRIADLEEEIRSFKR